MTATLTRPWGCRQQLAIGVLGKSASRIWLGGLSPWEIIVLPVWLDRAAVAREACMIRKIKKKGALPEETFKCYNPVQEVLIVVSIIIPTLNEEKYIRDCLQSLSDSRCEVIVVDGGSTDKTVAIAESWGAKVIRMDIGNRARQMNVGAEVALGDLFLFFHADSRLPVGGMESMIKAMDDSKIIGGGFSLGFYPVETFYSCLAVGANLFCRMTRMIFGDRGMFIRANHFRCIGKFTEMDIMEDAALATSMRRLGKMVILSDVVMTSARKYAKETKLQAVYRTLWAYAAYRLGVPAAIIKAGYYGLGKKRS